MSSRPASFTTKSKGNIKAIKSRSNILAESNNVIASSSNAGEGDVSLSTSSSAQVSDDDMSWLQTAPPSSALPPHDTNFVLEDELLSSHVESVCHLMCVVQHKGEDRHIAFSTPAFDDLMKEGDNMEAINELVRSLDLTDYTTAQLTLTGLDYTIFHDLITVIPIKEHTGDCRFSVLLHVDIEKTDDSVIQRWSEQARTTFSGAMICDPTHPQMQITSLDSGLLNLSGYTAKHLVGCSVLCMTGPDTKQEALHSFAIRTRLRQHDCSHTMVWYKQSGTPFWVCAVTCPLTPPPIVTQSTTSRPLYNASLNQAPSSPHAQQPGQHKSVLVLIGEVTLTRLKRLGKYILGKPIGQGAFGVVRIAKSSLTDELVAVKAVAVNTIRSVEEVNTVQHEIELLSSLHHPSIVRLLEAHFSQEGMSFHLVMEFVPGGSLANYIWRQPDRKLSEAEAQRIFQQVAAAMEYCHCRRNVVHRDLKPENILLDSESNVKIVDFGLSTIVTPYNSALTARCGTPQFSAPELLAGHEYDGTAVDIWSMGVILYEALCGFLPFKGNKPAEVLKSINTNPYPDPPEGVSASCISLLQRMMCIQPEERMTMDELMMHPWIRSHRHRGSMDVERRASEDNVAGQGSRAPSAPPFLKNPSSHGTPHSKRDREYNDSVRLVIPEFSMEDDPISAAIFRVASTDPPANDPEAELLSLASPQHRDKVSKSFTAGMSPFTYKQNSNSSHSPPHPSSNRRLAVETPKGSGLRSGLPQQSPSPQDRQRNQNGFLAQTARSGVLHTLGAKEKSSKGH